MSTTIASPETLRITRTFKAPPERVFAAFASAALMNQWFGPGPMELVDCTMDFRVGGAYRIKVQREPSSDPMAVSGVYREIAAPTKLVFTWKWEDDEDWEKCESVVSLDFKAASGGTELSLVHTGFPSTESAGNHEKGWGGCWAKLEKLLG